MNSKTLVIGASSTIGMAATRHIIGLGRSRVAAATRDPARITEALAEPVRFDWLDQDSWPTALAGVDRIFLIVPETSQEAPMLVRQFLGLAVAGGVRRVVTLSARGVDEFPGHPLQVVDSAVMDMAPEWVVLRPNWFMHNFTSGVLAGALAEQDVIRVPGGDASISFVHGDDVGAVAADLLDNLTQPEALNRSYDLTGPQSLTFADVAQIISSCTGRQVRYEKVDIDDPDLSAKVGVPTIDRRMVVALFSRVIEGGESSVSADIETVLGRSAKSFPEFARSNFSSLVRT